jgi:hypothetical protein
MGKAKITTGVRPGKVRKVPATDSHRWMPFFPALWLDDPEILDPTTGIRSITMAQEAAYLRLCLAQFRDPRGIVTPRKLLLCVIVGCELEEYETFVAPVLRKFFSEVDGGWSHDTVRALWTAAHDRTIAARKSVGSRWRKYQEAKGQNTTVDTIEHESYIQRKEERGMRKEEGGITPHPAGGAGARAPGEPKPIEEQTDQQAAVMVWVEKMGPVGVKGKGGRWTGGMSPSRIVASLAPLFKTHGREKVLSNWRRYLSTREPQFASPEDFCTKYLAWASARGVKPVPL